MFFPTDNLPIYPLLTYCSLLSIFYVSVSINELFSFTLVDSEEIWQGIK